MIGAALALALAMTGVQDAPLPGDQQIDAFLAVLGQGKLAEAEAMVVADPTYRVEPQDVAGTLPKRAFLDWLGNCRKGLYVNMAFPTLADGTVTRAFRLECRKRGAAANAPYSEKIAFFVSSKGDGIKIY